MKRFLGLMGVALTLVLGVGIVLPPQVAQAAISPLAPDPINILPSVVRAGTKGGATQTYAAWNSILINVLQQAKKSKEFWAIVAADKAGTATLAQKATLATAKAGFKIPAFKPQALLKTGAGVGTAAILGFEGGYMIGDLGLQAFGVDKTGTVCEESATAGVWLEIASRVDCTEFKKNAEFVANLGVVPGLIGPKVCSAAIPGDCIQLLGQGTNWSTYKTYCFLRTGGTTTSWGLTQQGVTAPFSIALNPSSTQNSNCAAYRPPMNAGAHPPNPIVTYGCVSTQPSCGPPQAAPIETITPNPTRTFKCVVAGSNGQTYTAHTAEFRETDEVIPNPVCPQLPAGVTPTRITITEEGGGETHTVYDQPATPESTGHRNTYPECMDGTCLLDLRKGLVSCFQVPADCLEWFTDPNKANTYHCWYGTHAVSLAECNVYAPSFNGDPDVTGHPDTGDPFGPNPKPNPGDKKGFERPVSDPAKARICHPTGWGVFNPLEWVMKPVQCALEWAFVPRPTVIQAQNNLLRNTITGSVLGSTTALTAAFTAPFDRASTGCQGPPFRFQTTFGGGDGMDSTFYPLDACSGFMKTFALFSNIASGGIVLLGAGLASIRYFASLFGFVGMGSKVAESSSGVRFRDEGR